MVILNPVLQTRKLWMHVMEGLSWHCRTTSCLQPGRDRMPLPRCLDLAIALLQIDIVRDIWLAAPEWKPAFEGFFTIKVVPSPFACRQQPSLATLRLDVALLYHNGGMCCWHTWQIAEGAIRRALSWRHGGCMLSAQS